MFFQKIYLLFNKLTHKNILCFLFSSFNYYLIQFISYCPKDKFWFCFMSIYYWFFYFFSLSLFPIIKSYILLTKLLFYFLLSLILCILCFFYYSIKYSHFFNLNSIHFCFYFLTYILKISIFSSIYFFTWLFSSFEISFLFLFQRFH